MAFDAYTADRLRRILTERKLDFQEKKMMGGLCIMLNDKMLCGLLADKQDGQPMLMARVGPEKALELSAYENVVRTAFSQRPMKGFVFAKADAFDADRDFETWIDHCLSYHPFAKATRKRKK